MGLLASATAVAQQAPAPAMPVASRQVVPVWDGKVPGTVDSAQADGTITLLTRNGTFVTLHHPPELTLAAGNTIVLRVTQTGPPVTASRVLRVTFIGTVSPGLISNTILEEISRMTDSAKAR